MSEARTVGTEVESVVPGVWYWQVHDERIDFLGSAHAVSSDEGVVLIDPHRLASEALESLGDVVAIVLTTSSHQRSAWRLRRELGVPVYAPILSREVDEEPDAAYSEGDRLPGNLIAIFTPGAGTRQHSLLMERAGGVLFTPDLFSRARGGALQMVPAEYMHDPEEARRSVEKLLEYEFSVLCTGHGAPVLEDAKGSIRGALAA